jgi:hypothetical protein
VCEREGKLSNYRYRFFRLSLRIPKLVFTYRYYIFKLHVKSVLLIILVSNAFHNLARTRDVFKKCRSECENT